MNKFSAIDWTVLALYLLATVLIGTAFYRKQETAHDYLLAGRSMPSFPIAISIIVTGLSALSYMGFLRCLSNRSQVHAERFSIAAANGIGKSLFLFLYCID